MLRFLGRDTIGFSLPGFDKTGIIFFTGTWKCRDFSRKDSELKYDKRHKKFGSLGQANFELSAVEPEGDRANTIVTQ